MPTISKPKPKITWLQVLIHSLGWLPLAWLVYAFFAGRLSVNPIQELSRYQHWLGFGVGGLQPPEPGHSRSFQRPSRMENRPSPE